MRKVNKRVVVIIVCIAVVFIVVVAAIVPKTIKYYAARKRADPIILMLRQSTNYYDGIGRAVNSIGGLRFVTRTNAVTGVVSDYHLDKNPDFKPLSKQAAAMVQDVIIRRLPHLEDTVALNYLFRALMAFREQDTLTLSDADWHVVEDAMDRFNSQQKPDQIQYHVSLAPDGVRWVSGSGPVRH